MFDDKGTILGQRLMVCPVLVHRLGLGVGSSIMGLGSLAF